MMPARTVYLATSFFWGMLFWMMATVFMVYQIEVVGLDALQLVLVGTALELTAFICEVPTGVVADNWSRKASIIIGYLLTGMAFLLMAAAPVFWVLIVSSIVWGIGWTFVSGAREAWLADEIGESAAAGLYLRGARLLNYGAFLGIGVAVAVGSIELHYPLILSGLIFVLWSLSLIYLMPETGFSPAHDSTAPVMDTLRQGIGVVRASSTLIVLMVVSLVFGIFSEGYDRLSGAHVLRSFTFHEALDVTPVVAFGAMTAAGILLSVLAVALAERLVDTDNVRQLSFSLALVVSLVSLCVLLFAFTVSLWLAMLLYVVLQPVRSVIYPLTMAWFNRNIPSRTRATVLSMHGQFDALGQIAGGPAMGLVGRELGLRVALGASALLLLPAVWLYGRVRAPADRLATRE